MKTKSIVLLACGVVLLVPVQAQVTLQPWTQVFGTTPGAQLGFYVNGHSPTSNFPFRASVYQLGNTGVYTLQNQTDTTVRGVFMGENLKTGDLNGDGWTDVVIHKSGGTTYVDTVLIYWGTSTGIDTVSPTRLTGSNVRETFGSSVCIGNVVGDSTVDLIITAPQCVFGTFEGRVYIYRGGSVFDTVASVVLQGDSAYFNLGWACAVGDLNNDGHTDLILRGVHSAPPRYNYVDIWFGRVPFDTTKDIRLISAEIGSSALGCFEANGDGIDDLLWTKRDSTLSENYIAVHLGGSSFDTIPSLRLQNPGVANFGNAIIDGGDMDGDGRQDVVVAAYRASNTSGFVFVYAGGPRLDETFDAAVGLSSASDFGRSVASVGDITSDGFADIIVGAPAYAFGNNKGYWGVFKGDSTITSVGWSSPIPTAFTLHQSYPNPFNPSANVRYDLLVRAEVQLEVFNIIGQRVALLVHEIQPPGTYNSVLDASTLASGAYVYRLTAKTDDGKTFTDAKKMTLVR
ncbi:MAG TPA: hypothetical protein DGH68_07230 [Bacteroidetes bacterium]|nr:hypothetical protein [Bacteroidota bacterium]